MLSGVAEAISGTVRCQLRLAEEFQNGARKRLTITGLNKKPILPVLDDFGYVAHLCCDDWASAGESFSQHDRRRFGAQGSDHDHVTCGVNIGCVPPIACHDDLIAESGAVDRVSYIDPTFKNTGALTNYHEARIGPLS